MQRLDNLLLWALVITGFLLAARESAPATAAPLASDLKIAAVAPSQEAEKQREARLIEAAKKEGKLLLWAGGPAKEWANVFNKFRERYPFLVVEHWRGDDPDMHQRITSEAKAGVYNVDFMGGEISYLAELKKTGLMKKYNWPNAVGWSAEHKDPEGYWVTRNIIVVVASYNTNLVSPSEAPKNWDDLLDPKWKGTISMDKEGADWVLMFWAAWGKEKTVNYLKNLAKNNIALGPGATARTEMLGAGAYKIDLRLNLHGVLDYQKKGAPLEWIRTDPILAKATPIFIAEHAPHPNAAMLFADWFTSLEGQQAYYDATGRLLPHPKVKSRISDALKGLRVVQFPPELVVHGREAETIWRDIFYK
jgi:iron(III) transport system substrate-binding protein